MDNTTMTVCKKCKAWIMYDMDLDEKDIPKFCIECEEIDVPENAKNKEPVDE